MGTITFFRHLSRVNRLTTLRRIKELTETSKLMTLVISLFCLSYLAGTYWLSYTALSFLHKHFPLVGTIVLERMVFTVFGVLSIMLVLSSAVIGYSTLFKNKETYWLFPHPISYEILYRWKSVEALILSSWAFVFLLLPVLAAYGVVFNAPALFYLITPFYLTAFVLICGVFGFILLFLFIWLVRYRMVVISFLALWIALTLYTVASIISAPPPDPDSFRTTHIMNQILDNTRFLTHPVWPGYWLSRGLLSALDGALTSSIFFLMLLTSNALFIQMLSFTILSKFYAKAWNSVHTRSHRDRMLMTPAQIAAPTSIWHSPFTLVKIIFRPLLGQPGAGLLWKDLKTFFRDTQQWLQFAVFFGIMGVYILNLQKMRLDVQTGFWTNFIAHMNLAACAMTLGTLTTRFVFPQFSLEGRRLWLVGLSPIGLRGVIWQKFWSSVCGSGLIVVGLTLISCLVLSLPVWQMVQFIIVIILMTMALSSLAVGLGVIYPNFKEDNPAKIVSGFGGTLCLVLTFLYIILCVACLAVPAQMETGSRFAEKMPEHFFLLMRIGGLLFVTIASTLAIILPLRIALNRAEKLEL